MVAAVELKLEHVGGWPGLNPDHVYLVRFEANRIVADFLAGGAPHALPRSTVQSIEISGSELPDRRVQSSRLFFIGLYAFLFRKREAVGFIVLKRDSGDIILRSRDNSPMQLRAALSGLLPG